MYLSYKTELNPTDAQKKIIEQYFRICIHAFNSYVSYNQGNFDRGFYMISSDSYLDLIRDGLISDTSQKVFLKRIYKPAVLYTLKIAEKGIKNYVDNKGGMPKLKKHETKNISLHFYARSINRYNIACERHRIYIPFIGWIRLKEKGYIPYKGSNKYIVSGWIKKDSGRYYISALTDEPRVIEKSTNATEGLGIDLNINNLATVSDGTVFENINKTDRIKRLEKSIKRQSRCLSRRFANLKSLPIEQQNAAKRKNLKKQFHRIDILYRRLRSIRQDDINKCVRKIIDKNPRYITMEDLKIQSMESDTRFSKFLYKQSMFELRKRIQRQAKLNGIEFRTANRWFPSSKLCHECGEYFKGLKIDDREFVCPNCGSIICRDLNASLNLRDTKDYFVWS